MKPARRRPNNRPITKGPVDEGGGVRVSCSGPHRSSCFSKIDSTLPSDSNEQWQSHDDLANKESKGTYEMAAAMNSRVVVVASSFSLQALSSSNLSTSTDLIPNGLGHS